MYFAKIAIAFGQFTYPLSKCTCTYEKKKRFAVKQVGGGEGGGGLQPTNLPFWKGMG